MIDFNQTVYNEKGAVLYEKIPAAANDLTKREWFAGQAMAGFLRGSAVDNFLWEDIARMAVEAADHLILALAAKEVDKWHTSPASAP